MNYRNVFKRETKVIAYVVICLTLVVMGVSYALFLQVNDNKENQIVTAGSLEITYAKGNVVTVNENGENNCLMPQSDEDGLKNGCVYLLSIYNSGTLPMEYDLLIYDDVLPAGGEAVSHKYIKHSLSKQFTEADKLELVTLPEKRALDQLELKETKRVLERAVIEPKETITFTLRIWIDEDAPGNDIGSEGSSSESIVGKYVYLKLDVSGVVYEEEAASTMLISKENTDLQPIATSTTYGKDNQEYRYVGSNPNNYVYFNCVDDTQISTCEVWRMMGIYNITSGQTTESRIKLINASSEESKVWDEKGNTNYEETSLNKYLSTTYYDSLSTTSKGQIDKGAYYLEGVSSLAINALTMYAQELASNKIISTPVGLMQISDYGFAGGIEEAALDTIAERKNANWLYTGKKEWFVNPSSEGKIYALDEEGTIITSEVLEEKLVRPVVYLDSNIKIIGGEGTSSQPYRLSK